MSGSQRYRAALSIPDAVHLLLAQDVVATFALDYDQQFDQAGLMLRATRGEWIETGVKVSDGAAQVGAVVTHRYSNWSVAPVPHWSGRKITIRASRHGGAVTVRARVDDEPVQMVRLAHLDPALQVAARPYCCAPTRAGLTVSFTRWVRTPPDTLH